MMKLNERLIMSDEMTVQHVEQKQPSALPYILGGGIVGGTGGYFGANYLPFKKPMYSSYEDIIKEVNEADSFDKLRNSQKSDDVKKALEEAKTQAEKLKAAEGVGLTYQDLIGAKADVLEENNAARKAYEEAVQKLKDKAPTDTQIEEVAKELNKDAKEITDEMKTKAKEAIEKDKKKYRKYFENEISDVETKLDDLYKAAGDKKIFSDEVAGKYNALKNAKEEAKKALEPLLEKCTKGNKVLWAGIGAAALAIIGLMLRPKAKENV